MLFPSRTAASLPPEVRFLNTMLIQELCHHVLTCCLICLATSQMTEVLWSHLAAIRRPLLHPPILPPHLMRESKDPVRRVKDHPPKEREKKKWWVLIRRRLQAALESPYILWHAAWRPSSRHMLLMHLRCVVYINCYMKMAYRRQTTTTSIQCCFARILWIG